MWSTCQAMAINLGTLDLSLLKIAEISRKPEFPRAVPIPSSGMVTTLFALVSFRFRSRASLELELVALRHQAIVLRRQRPHGLRLLSADRLLRVWLLPSAATGPRNLAPVPVTSTVSSAFLRKPWVGFRICPTNHDFPQGGISRLQIFRNVPASKVRVILSQSINT
jgi:hypothetical protein